MEFGTRLIHQSAVDPQTGGLSIPVYQASTFHQADLDVNQTYQYSRSQNPTRQALEDLIAELEGGTQGFAFSSGMAAIGSALAIFSAGDHLVVGKDVYGGTFRIVRGFFNRFGLTSTLVDTTDLEAVRAAIGPKTRGIFIETPSNPLMKITDIGGIAAIARDKGLITLIDNTFMSPYWQRPLELGIDVTIHSASKFLGGHSDIIGGLVAVRDNTLGARIRTVQNSFGAILGPQDSWLVLRGARTLKVRLDAQQDTARQVASWLRRHPRVDQVWYPGLEDHPGREIHRAQSTGDGAVLSFCTGTSGQARRFLDRVRLAAVAVSLGGVETIASYPVRMSHEAIPPSERAGMGITDALIRLSLGLEDPDDLIRDFEQALADGDK